MTVYSLIRETTSSHVSQNLKVALVTLLWAHIKELIERNKKLFES